MPAKTKTSQAAPVHSGPLESMRILSVQQPFASALINGTKPFENRSWATPYRGRVYIHASKLCPRPARDTLEECSECPGTVMSMWDAEEQFVTGAIIGAVDLIEILDTNTIWILAQTPLDATELDYEEYRLLYPSQRAEFLPKWKHVHAAIKAIPEDVRNAHATGSPCWLVANPRKLVEPIPILGKLNLWKLSLPAARLKLVDVAIPAAPSTDPPVKAAKVKAASGTKRKGVQSK